MYNVFKNFFSNPLLLPEAHQSVYFYRAQALFSCMFEYVKRFKKFLQKAFACAWSPTPTVLSQSAYFVQLYVCICLMFQKTSSASHCLCLKPTTQCTFTERMHCSIVCLNVYNVSKNFFWKTLFLLEAHHAVNFHRVHTLFNCIFECVLCFKKLFLKPIASAWGPPLSAHSQHAYIVQFYVWMCIMLWKYSSETHCVCLKPTTQFTSTEGILCSSVCLNV